MAGQHEKQLAMNVTHHARQVVGEPGNPLDMGNSIAMNQERVKILSERLLTADRALRDIINAGADLRSIVKRDQIARDAIRAIWAAPGRVR